MKRKAEKITVFLMCLIIGLSSYGCANKLLIPGWYKIIEGEEGIPASINVEKRFFSDTDDSVYIAEEEDSRGISDIEYTFENLVATDVYGRNVMPHGSAVTDAEGNQLIREVGMFYFALLGQHEQEMSEIYNVTDLLRDRPDDLWSLSSNYSPTGKLHVWGEPLFGYYDSRDPWVINRHVQMLIDLGIDFIGYDQTNSTIYDEVFIEIFKSLDYYQKQGYKVPKVMFLINTNSPYMLTNLYNNYYKPSTAQARGSYYPNLWYYSPDNQSKPLISLNMAQMTNLTPEQATAYEFFNPIYCQWPQDTPRENAISWIEFQYPQYNHNGDMSVSVAQHSKTLFMSDTDKNWGRGYSQPGTAEKPEKGLYLVPSSQMLPNAGENSLAWGRAGRNLSRQWQTVFNSLESEKPVKRVFITGFNEWTMVKFDDGRFCDTFNEEYSRDIEPMKGGYNDNFLLLTLANINRYKYDKATRYILPKKNIAGYDDSQWANVRSYVNYITPSWAEQRDFKGFTPTLRYTDNTFRNNIKTTQVIHDSQFLYIKVTTAKTITERENGDTNFMNIWLGSGGDKAYGDYNYVINRYPGENGKTSIERSKGGFSWEKTGEIDCTIIGNTMYARIPLSLINVNPDAPRIKLKVSDNVLNPENIMNFFLYGNSAPMGRLSYAYGI